MGLKRKFKKWIEEVVQKPKSIGNFPVCPYAKPAMENDRVEIIKFRYKFTDLVKLQFGIYWFLRDILESWNDSKDLILVLDSEQANYYTIKTSVEELNKEFRNKDLILLFGHPDKPTTINGVITTFPDCPVIYIQRLSRLLKASEDLKKTTYYKYWSEEQINELKNRENE